MTLNNIFNLLGIYFFLDYYNLDKNHWTWIFIILLFIIRFFVLLLKKLINFNNKYPRQMEKESLEHEKINQKEIEKKAKEMFKQSNK